MFIAMHNFILLKKILLSILISAACILLFFLITSYANTPSIEKIENLNFQELKNSSSLVNEKDYLIEENNQIEFNYKLVGIRYGDVDSSVIVKKGNKETLVKIGESLENSFELIEVNQNDALFRNGQKIYRIKKLKDQ